MLFKATLLAAAATIASTANVNYPPELYAFVGAQANATLAQVPAENAYPANGSPGKYGWGTSNYGGWTSGFFPGLLFKLYNYRCAADSSSRHRPLQQLTPIGIIHDSATSPKLISVCTATLYALQLQCSPFSGGILLVRSGDQTNLGARSRAVRRLHT